MKYTLLLDEDLHREFKIVCVTNGIDMSEVMRSLIREYLDGQAPVYQKVKKRTKKSK